MYDHLCRAIIYDLCDLMPSVIVLPVRKYTHSWYIHQPASILCLCLYLGLIQKVFGGRKQRCKIHRKKALSYETISKLAFFRVIFCYFQKEAEKSDDGRQQVSCGSCLWHAVWPSHDSQVSNICLLVDFINYFNK